MNFKAVKLRSCFSGLYGSKNVHNYFLLYSSQKFAVVNNEDGLRNLNILKTWIKYIENERKRIQTNIRSRNPIFYNP